MPADPVRSIAALRYLVLRWPVAPTQEPAEQYWSTALRFFRDTEMKQSGIRRYLTIWQCLAKQCSTFWSGLSVVEINLFEIHHSSKMLKPLIGNFCVEEGEISQ